MSNSESENNVQHKVTKEFKNNVLTWVGIDDKIRESRKKVKELNLKKKEFEENILKYLTEVDEESIMLIDGKLSKVVSTTKESLKKENIHSALIEITGDANKAIILTEHILKSRKEIKKVRLTRTCKKKK
jgi:uncharacterized HAD superfamily protein